MHDWGAHPPYEQPVLRLFLSADIVGSTALKQEMVPAGDEAVPDSSRWFEILQGFYLRSVTALAEEWDRAAAAADPGTLGDAPVLWKTIGDEVLFWKDLDEHRQLGHAMGVWIAAIDRVRAYLKRLNPRLDLKCTAWLGHFPWRNKMLISSPDGIGEADADGIPASNARLMHAYHDAAADRARYRVDFVGPAIDIGFRLATMSTYRKFVVGMDVAYLLALDLADDPGRLCVRFDGMREFKGVLGGLHYPLFWIDMGGREAIDVFERALGHDPGCAMDAVARFCESYYDEKSNYLYRPFLVSPREDVLTRRPGWYDAAHLAMLGHSPAG